MTIQKLFWGLILLPLVSKGEFVFHDLNLSETTVGDEVPVLDEFSSEFPRGLPTNTIFGETTVDEAPDSSPGKCLRLTKIPSDPYGQIGFGMVGPELLIYQGYQMEFEFQFEQPGILAPFDGFSFFPEGTTVFRMDFHRNASISLYYQTLDPDENRFVIAHEIIGSFDPNNRLRVAMRIMHSTGVAEIWLNGEKLDLDHLFDGSAKDYGNGLHNWKNAAVPRTVRYSYQGPDDSSVLLKNVRTIGVGLPVPTLIQSDDHSEYPNGTIVPISTPDSGTWQLKYSHDLKSWEDLTFNLPGESFSARGVYFPNASGPRGYISLVSAEPDP